MYGNKSLHTCDSGLHLLKLTMNDWKFYFPNIMPIHDKVLVSDKSFISLDYYSVPSLYLPLTYKLGLPSLLIKPLS